VTKTPAQKAAQKRYAERNPGKLRAARRRYDEKRAPRDMAEYMREYRRRKKLEREGDGAVE
jgi:hypothetical protein